MLRGEKGRVLAGLREDRNVCVPKIGGEGDVRRRVVLVRIWCGEVDAVLEVVCVGLWRFGDGGRGRGEVAGGRRRGVLVGQRRDVCAKEKF